MRRWLLVSLLALVAAVALGLRAGSDTGFVLVHSGPWLVQANLTLAVAALVVLFIVVYALVRAAAGLLRSPRRLRRWLRIRRRRRAQARLTQGLLALAEGRWARAEKRLLAGAEASEAPLLHYLGAARAAQGQGAYARRDAHLHRAHASTPSSEVAVALTQAELQLGQARREQALATLTHLHPRVEGHEHVERLLLRVSRELGDWRTVLGLIPALRRRRVLDRDVARGLEVEAHAALLERAPADLAEAQRAWEEVPAPLRAREELLALHACRLIELGAGAEAERLLRGALESGWKDSLGYLYGLAEGPDPKRQLALVERHLEQRPGNAVLLLTLGRLCTRCGLWGKGRSYLEASVGFDERPETYRALADLLARMDEEEAAAECARKGLVAATGEGADPARVRSLAGIGASLAPAADEPLARAAEG